MITEAQKRATKKYDQEKTIRVSVKLNKNTDDDIIQRLAQENNKQGFIKTILRQEIYNKGGK